MSGYEDIDRLQQEQNSLLEQQETKQQEMIDNQTQLNINELERNKNKLDKETVKTNQGLYTEYKKQSNQFGASAEQLARQGLGNSGYAETTETSLFNTYQKNVTETLNNSRDLKADFDFQISQTMKQADVQKANASLEIYAQRLQLATQLFQFRKDREQFLYSQDRDRISDEQWQKTFDEQMRQNELENEWKQRTFDYQQERDAVGDSQWERQYALSKKAKASSGSRSVKMTPSNDSPSDTTTSQSNESTSMEENQLYKILRFNEPNSKQRQVALNRMVGNGQLSREEADKLLSAG